MNGACLRRCRTCRDGEVAARVASAEGLRISNFDLPKLPIAVPRTMMLLRNRSR
jgi:hypothetical protein